MLKDFFDTRMVLLIKTVQPDGFGSFVTSYRDGAAFDAGVIRDTSTQMIIAEQSGTNAVYTIVFAHGLQLSIGDHLKRLSDGAMFEVMTETIMPPKVASPAMQHGEAKIRRVTIP